MGRSFRWPGPGSHSLDWISECGRQEDGDPVGYCIEGTVQFEDVEVLRADLTPQPLDQFTADADRYWKALHRRDERLSVAARHRGAPWSGLLFAGFPGVLGEHGCQVGVKRGRRVGQQAGDQQRCVPCVVGPGRGRRLAGVIPVG
jgi:hypothetical protein